MHEEGMFKKPALPDKSFLSDIDKSELDSLWKALNKHVNQLYSNQKESWHDDYDTSIEILTNSDAEVQQLINECNYEKAAAMIVKKVEEKTRADIKNKIKNRRFQGKGARV